MPNTKEKSVQGVIFNIQHYSIHDGPGIRTTVFIKAAPCGASGVRTPSPNYCSPKFLTRKSVLVADSALSFAPAELLKSRRKSKDQPGAVQRER